MEDWVEPTLGELTAIKGGKRLPKGHKYANEKTDFPYLRVKDFGHNTIDISNLKFLNKETQERISRYTISHKDVYISIAGTIGRVGYIPESLSGSNLTENAAKIIGVPQILNKYLVYYLSSITAQSEISKYTKATSQPKLALFRIGKLKFPLSPLPIQRGIVTKIESLFTHLDSGIADLKKAQAQMKIYRQAVLKKAFEGELTKEWRAQQTDLPSADELLEQIKEEREKHYEGQLEDWKKAVEVWEENGKEGKKPSRISKPKIQPEVQGEDVQNYEQLPKEWSWSKFGNVTYKIGDIDHKMPKTVENGLPYLSTGNIKADGKIDFDNAKTISRADFDRLALKIKPEKGDIIFPRYGTIGRNILIEIDKEFLVSYSCAIIKNITKLMDAKFALYYSLSPLIKKEIRRYVVQTTQANIGIASIESFVFPLCSKKEQHQIVKQIESRLSVCDKVEENILTSLAKAKALRQSILKKAFEGKLLTAEEIAECKRAADYEPASVLLEKIKKEKIAT